MRRLILELMTFPPHHSRHQKLLEDFNTVASFERSVFVMTKFPDLAHPGPRDDELTAVIEGVRQSIEGCGFTARLANDKHYHPALWDNVELYLLGCSRGVAIVEDRYMPELNPNVAMEWGWMRGMGRSVLYLIEKDFKLERADWGGLLRGPFDWDDPLPGIASAVRGWLPS